MSTITWLHLSDLHYKTADNRNAEIVMEALLKDVRECINSGIGRDKLLPDFIVFTGDVAHSGKQDEYELAESFFKDLLDTVGLDRERLFLVPGNHDVDRVAIEKWVGYLGDTLTDRERTDAVLSSQGAREHLLARFHGYREFVHKYWNEYLQFDDENYFYVRCLSLAEKQVAVLGLNSAWLCASDEDETKKLVVGDIQVREALSKAKSADLKIALIHHPFELLREFDRNDSETLLLENCDFILRGHLHRPRMNQLISPDNTAMMIAGGACYVTRKCPNSYNFVRLDFTTRTGTVYLRRYSEEQGGFWAKDTLTYRNAPDGKYVFQLAGESFALLKPVEELSPQDLRFQILKYGEELPSDRLKRPYYTTYIPRKAIPQDFANDSTYTEDALRRELRAGNGFVLVGQPLEGKTRTLYEIVKGMQKHVIVSPFRRGSLPPDTAFSKIEGKRTILLLDDLHTYVGGDMDLLEFHNKLSDYASSCVVASTCRDGSELKTAEENLTQFYENVPLKLKLSSPTSQEKERLARNIGKKDWSRQAKNEYPTLGSITMARQMEPMNLRFRTLDRNHSEQADTLRALQLLSHAGILPLTYERIQGVLTKIYRRYNAHLRDCLRSLEEQSFLRSSQDPVQPEPAYLEEVVKPTPGETTEDNFSELRSVLQTLNDHEGLFYLGNTYALVLKDNENALLCYEQATKLNRTFGKAWNNMGLVHVRLNEHEKALKAFEEATREFDLDASWNNKGMVLGALGRYDEALQASEKALSLDRNSAHSWDTKSWILLKLERYREALEASDKALELIQSFPDALQNKGIALAKLDRNDEAVEYLCRAWGERERLPDRGGEVASILQELGHDPEKC